MTQILGLYSGTSELNIILLIGIAVLAGTLAGKVFQRFRIPQIVGYVLVGIILGPVLKIIPPQKVHLLEPLSLFALGIIGFMIGGELRAEVFKKYGKQFFIILFSQGIGAFLLVAIGSSAVAWMITKDIGISVSIGLVLGAIGSATAPAATVNVLWEYKTRGPLTVAILAIVALDDALALLLYRCAATAAKALTGSTDTSAINTVLLLAGEIIGAILLGFTAGVLLYFILKVVRSDEKILLFSVAWLLLIVGSSMIANMDPILPAMTFGITIANLMPRRSKDVFELVKNFSPPIYVAFFVLAGAHIVFERMAIWVVAMIIVYSLTRAAGKVIGTWLGAKYVGSVSSVRKYLGICLLPQAGVAIGLAILSGQLFKEIDAELANMIIMVIMSATFVMEILGPMLVKIGVKKAGEVGMNITEDDLIATYKVTDVMNKKAPVIASSMSLSQVIQIVSTTDSFYYAVIDTNNNLAGAITLDGIRNTFTTQELNDWLVALDLTEPVIATVTADIPLSEAFEKTGKLNIEYLPVTENNNFIGLLDCPAVRRSLSAEVLSRQKKADSMHDVRYT